MKRLLLSGMVAAALAACAPSAPPATPAPATPAPAAPRPAPATPAPIAQAPSPSDQCGAGQMQYLVGKLRSEIPVPANPALRRVACTTCPVTMDYNPARLNILFDADTGVIKTVRCG